MEPLRRDVDNDNGNLCASDAGQGIATFPVRGHALIAASDLVYAAGVVRAYAVVTPDLDPIEVASLNALSERLVAASEPRIRMTPVRSVPVGLLA